VTPSDTSPSDRDSWKHPLGPYRVNHSGVPTLEMKWFLLSETSSLGEPDYCSRCRGTIADAKILVDKLGHEAYVHLSVSKDGHIFAFRPLRRASVRRLHKRLGLPTPPPFVHGKLPREGRRMKIYFSASPNELSLLDEVMKRLGFRTRAVMFRAILFDWLRREKFSPEPDPLVKTQEPAYPTAVVSVGTHVRLSPYVSAEEET
jgi:hypothetical protein